jgi:hypothetical protein
MITQLTCRDDNLLYYFSDNCIDGVVEYYFDQKCTMYAGNSPLSQVASTACTYSGFGGYMSGACTSSSDPLVFVDSVVSKYVAPSRST